MIAALASLVALVAAPAVTLPDDPLEPVSVNGTSLSTVSSGTLTGGAYLERDGEHHTALPVHRGRDNRFGTVELVSLIRHASAKVALEFPGTKLHVGNLSQRGGGDLKMSVSHNSGRDADLAFYCTDSAGAPDQPKGFVRYNSEGWSRKPAGRYQFDTPRNWALVKALLRTGGQAGDGVDDVVGEVQFLFISRGLKQQLMEHGRTKGEDAELLRRADKVLKQPTGSLPHDDHLHLRVYCPPDDLMDGCRNYGPTWDWVDDHALLRHKRAVGLAKVLVDPDSTPLRRTEAMDLLEAIRGVEAAPWLIALASPTRRYAELGLRERALEVLGSIRPEHAAQTLARLALRTPDAAGVALILDVLAALGDARVWPLVASLLPDPREVPALRQLEARAPASKKLRHKGRKLGEEPLGVRAARTLAALDAVEAIPALLDRLTAPDAAPSHRLWAAKALRRLTNARPTRTRWKKGRAKSRAKGALAWRRWWLANRHHDRDRWLHDGFAAARRSALPPPDEIELISDDAVPDLLQILRSRERHLAHNAREALRRIAKLRPWRQGDPYIGRSWWKRWWKTHRRRTRKGIRGGADVGVRGILRHAEPVPVTTRTKKGMRTL